MAGRRAPAYRGGGRRDADGTRWKTGLTAVMVEPMTGIEPAYSAWNVFRSERVCGLPATQHLMLNP